MNFHLIQFNSINWHVSSVFNLKAVRLYYLLVWLANEQSEVQTSFMSNSLGERLPNHLTVGSRDTMVGLPFFEKW